jgi:dienelactone hydrolase
MERIRIGDIPALVAHRSRPGEAAARGTVLLYHPLGKAKELHAADLGLLADAGFLAIGIDAIAHGERRMPDGYRRFMANPMAALLEVVSATAAEVPGIVDELVGRGWAIPGRIGIAGVSLGGFVAYGAASSDRRIAAAVTIAASPRWGADPRSPHRHPERFHPLALLSITGGNDSLVPGADARELHHRLEPRYAATPERLRHMELPGETHWMSNDAWTLARAETERWFRRFLANEAAVGDAAALR